MTVALKPQGHPCGHLVVVRVDLVSIDCHELDGRPGAWWLPNTQRSWVQIPKLYNLHSQNKKNSFDAGDSPPLHLMAIAR